jgi:arylsulfatase A-like enzyme
MAQPQPHASSTRPNIVVIMTDQHRVGMTAGERPFPPAGEGPAGASADVGCTRPGTRPNGLPGPDTMPTLDRLMAGATRFDQAYTSCPICVPARTSLLTGRFPSAHGVRQNSTPDQARYESDLLDVLRSAGYGLHFSGKPHMYLQPADFDSYHGPFFHDSSPAGTPQQQAFDRWLQDLDHGVSQEPTPFPVECQYPSRIIDGAIEAVDAATAPAPAVPSDDTDPFFLWVSFPEPHNPYQVPEPYFSMFEDQVPERAVGPEVIDDHAADLDWRFHWLRELEESKRPGCDAQWRRLRANYLGMLRLIDDQIARLVEHLHERLGERAEDTVFLFLADHGDFLGEYGLQRKGAGLPESLVRIPLMIGGPGIAAQRRDEPVSIVDVLPTLAEYVGAPIPPGVQGRSLLPLLAGGPAPAEEFGSIYAELGYGGVSYRASDRPPLHFDYEGPSFDELNSVTMSGEMRMVRRGRHKLVVDDTGREYLYDLHADPWELIDLSARADEVGSDGGARADAAGPDCGAADADDLARVRLDLYRDLARWQMRVTDDLPVGDYTPRTAPHNWRWDADVEH